MLNVVAVAKVGHCQAIHTKHPIMHVMGCFYLCKTLIRKCNNYVTCCKKGLTKVKSAVKCAPSLTKQVSEDKQ